MRLTLSGAFMNNQHHSPLKLPSDSNISLIMNDAKAKNEENTYASNTQSTFPLKNRTLGKAAFDPSVTKINFKQTHNGFDMTRENNGVKGNRIGTPLHPATNVD